MPCIGRGPCGRWFSTMAFCLLAATPMQGVLAQSADATLNERLGFIEQRLDDGRLHAQIWQYGWTGVNSLGFAASVYSASTAGSDAGRVVGIVDATKSIVGLADLWLRPLPGLYGFDPIRELPGQSPDERRARLEAAERLLQADADRAAERTQLLPHLANVGINVAGGGIILAFDRTGDAVVSAVTGLLVGELQLLTAPWAPTTNLADYEARFGGFAKVAASMELRPRTNGIEVAFRF